jgi:autotransporter-associated beta strand protein
MHKPILSVVANAVGIVLTAGSLHGQLAISDSVQTYSTLTNNTVTLNGRSELHITGTNNPIAGSTISLNSHDSWLWFDNIRPSAVSSNHLGQIKVNGVQAVHGTNVRIVQYGMGTVVTPFTNAEQPLETFTEPGFIGESKRYNLYDYYDSAAELGSMHQNISSFKLKRGFMASFGTEPNGTGVTRLYIAQDHDVNIGSIPGNLDNAIQYVRVFPWRWVSKKGSCDVSADTLDAAWFYNWNNSTNSTLNWEYVPIRQQRWWPGYPSDKPSVTHLSGYNEPDNPIEDSYQTLGNGSRDVAIATWPELLQTGLRVGAPAVTDGGKWWLYDFMDKANAAGRRVDYIPVHFYQCGMSASQLKAWLQEIWDRYHKPIWVTEFNNGANWTGCGDPSYNQNADVIASWIDMMDNTPWIERYAVYSNVESVRNMVYSGGSLTPAGVIYKANKSPIGYQQESYPLSVRRGIVQLTMDGNTRDTSGHGNGGVSHGIPDFTTGTSGQCLNLDGSNRYLKLPTGIITSSGFTFGAWIQWDGGASNQRIFDFGNGTDQYLYLSPSVGGEMRFGLRNNSGTTTSISTAALAPGSWQHVAVTLEGTAAKIYLNGVLQAQGTFPDPTLSGTSLNFIGKSQWSHDPLFDGRIDELILMDSALDETGIAGLMAGLEAPFVAHWRGDVDSSWNTLNGGNTNWSADAAGSVETGKVPGGNTEVNFSDSVGNPSATSLGADLSVDSMVVTTPSPVGIGGSHDLTIGAKGVYVGNGAGPVTIGTSGSLILGANQSWVINSPNPFTVASALSGASTLTVSGAGTVELEQAGAWTGGLSIVGGGSVRVPTINASLGNVSQILMGGSGSTGSLIYTGSGETTGRVLTFQGGYGSPGMVLDQSGSGLLKLTSDLASVSFVGKTLTLKGSTTGEGELSGVVPNSGSTTSLIKLGSGKWTLSGVNTYSGTTSLREGTLAIGNNSAFGSGTIDLRGGTIASSDATPRTVANSISLSADSTFGGPGDLLFTGSVSGGTLSKAFMVDNARTEFSGVINGSGSRTKSGPGTLVLSATNTYTGPTSVSAGTLSVDGSLSAASAVTVASGATLTGTGNVNGPVTFDSGARLGWSLADHAGIAGKLTAGTVNATAGARVDLVFDGPGSTVDFSDPFWTQIHAWQVLASGGTTGAFALGTVSNDASGNPITGVGTFHLQQTPSGVSVFFAPEGLEQPAAPLGFSGVATGDAVVLTWLETEGAASYHILRSLTPGGPYETVATIISGTTFTDWSVNNGTTYYYAVAATNPNGISDPSAEWTATPHAASTIDKADNATDLALAESWAEAIVPTALDTARWAGLSGANPVVLGSDAAWKWILVGDTGGPVGISGTSTLTLGSGGIDMTAATQDLTLGVNLALGEGTQEWNVSAGRTLKLETGAFSRRVGSTLISLGSGTVSAAMAGLANDATGILGPWATAGAGAATRFANLSGGTMIGYTGGAPNTWSGTLNDAAANYDISAAGTTTYGASERVANTIRYIGPAGTTISLGNNSATGLTANGILNAGTGTITFTHGAGALTAAGMHIGASKELVLHAANAAINVPARIHDHGSGASAVTITGPNPVTFGGANTYTGLTTIASGSLAVSGGNLGSGEIRVVSGAALNLNTALTIAQTVTGRGTITGTSTTTLNGDFSGFSGIYIHNSTTNSTVVTHTASLSSRAAYHLASAQGSSQGLLTNIANGDHSFELGSLSGVANSLVRNGGSVNGASTLRIGALNTDSVFAGSIGGGGGTLGLTKIGTGMLTLSGTNSYNGPTHVIGGTLMVTGSLSGTGAVSIGDGGTLAGGGSCAGAVTLEDGGVLAPGNNLGGTLTLAGALALQDGAVLEMGMGTTSGMIAVGGNLTSSGVTTVNLTALDGFATGTYPLITAAGAISAANFEVGSAPAGFVYLLSANAGTLSLTIAVPPVLPANLTATGTATEVNLSWNPSPGASHYQVKRSGNGVSHGVIATVFGTSYADTSVVNGLIYSYVVTAWNAAGESDESNEAVAGLATSIATWRQTHFSTTENSGDAADLFDPDKDGLSNLLEYALGSNPNSRDIGVAPQIQDPSDRLNITFSRNAYALDVVLSVWGSDDLATWQELARSAGGAAFTATVDGVETGAPVVETGSGASRSVEVGDVILKGDPAHPKRFMKVHVER